MNNSLISIPLWESSRISAFFHVSLKFSICSSVLLFIELFCLSLLSFLFILQFYYSTCLPQLVWDWKAWLLVVVVCISLPTLLLLNCIHFIFDAFFLERDQLGIFRFFINTTLSYLAANLQQQLGLQWKLQELPNPKPLPNLVSATLFNNHQLLYVQFHLWICLSMCRAHQETYAIGATNSNELTLFVSVKWSGVSFLFLVKIWHLFLTWLLGSNL
jgi:hypothetical protein